LEVIGWSSLRGGEAYSMKVKTQTLQYEMQKLKERDERKQTLDARIYPVLPQRRPYIHVVKALMKSIASRQSSLFCEHNHDHFDPDFH